MKYSIIVPIYKVEGYLRDCINSVIHQSFNNWELILVNDGSPDRCSQICEEYAQKDSRVKVIHKSNGGLVSARKSGLELAEGDYAVCLDGDDFLHEDCLLNINKHIEHSNPDVVCFGYIVYTQKNERNSPITGFHFGLYDRKRMQTDLFPSLIYSKTGNRLPPVVWSKAFKMELYKKFQSKVPSQISMGEDGACTYPLICNAQSVLLMEDCLYYYRQVTTSMTKVFKPLKWENYDKVFALYEEEIDIDGLGLRKQMCRVRTHNLFNICMSQFYSDMPYIKVTNFIKTQFKVHPEYDIAINASNFSSLTMKLAQFSLKYKLYYLMKLYSQWKYVMSCLS